jgi:hypothetical protein
MRSQLNAGPEPVKGPTQKPNVVVRQTKATVVIQDRSPSMRAYQHDLDEQLKRRKLGTQYIFFSDQVTRSKDMTPTYVGGGTNIFPAFVELFSYIRTALPKKLDIVFISDGEDNHMTRCRRNFETHIGKLRQDFPEIEEHRLFTVGVGPNFPCNLVRTLNPQYM